jgi:hypothetical protein
MEQSPTSSGPIERQGAELGREEMLVWLRGDEPECAEYTLSADDVMSQLGIRRSRLTQISGRELRVGRMRRGRYVSPVYRQEDVDEYLSWTRATASHLKSSSVLSDAAEQLLKQGEALTRELTDVPATMAAEVRSEVRAAALQVERAGRASEEALARRLAEVEDRIDGSEERLKKILRGLLEGTERQTAAQNALAVAVQVLGRECGELSGLARMAREAQADRADELLGELDGIRDVLGLLLEPEAPTLAALPKFRRGTADARRVKKLVQRATAAAASRAQSSTRPPRRRPTRRV